MGISYPTNNLRKEMTVMSSHVSLTAKLKQKEKEKANAGVLYNASITNQVSKKSL